MKTIEELQAQLKQICAELDALKAAQSPETPETNFKEIAAKASRYPITGHPLAKDDEHTKEMYMLMLMSVIVLDSEKYTKSFMTFYRIAAGMGYNGNAEELMLKAQTMKFETLDEITRLFGKDDKRLMLLLECMLIAAQFDNGKRKAMEYIAELASLMNVSKEQITFLSNLARVILTQDLNEYKYEDFSLPVRYFDCYLCYVEKGGGIELLYADAVQGVGFLMNRLHHVEFDKGKIRLDYYNSLSKTSQCVNLTLSKKYICKLLNIHELEKINHNGEKVLYGVGADHPLAHASAIRILQEAYNKELEYSVVNK